MKKGRKKNQKIHLPLKKVILLASSILIIGVFMIVANIIASSDTAGKSKTEITESNNQETSENSAIVDDSSGEKAVIDKTGVDNAVINESDIAKTDKSIESENEVVQEKKAPVAKKAAADSKITDKNIAEDKSRSNNSEIPTEKEKEPLSGNVPSTNKKNAVKEDNTKNTQKKGILVFVFDDGGQNLTQLQPFLELPFPVTVAVMPSLTHSVEAAERVRKAGKELILHQPMQAINLSVNPGAGAITPDLHGEDIKALVRKNIAEIAPIAGLNNHEGSLITESLADIGCVLDVCKEQNIYFLDSRTTAESKAREAAAERNMNIWERNVFLDNTQNKDDILAEVDKGLALAQKNGYVIMIGHVWSNDLANILTELYPKLANEGYSFATITQLINGMSG